MVQLFYYESRGQRCQQLIRHDGPPIKVQLHAYEGWAQPALCSYLLLRFPWYRRKRCHITQIIGGIKQPSLTGRFIQSGVDGCMIIRGKLNKNHKKSDEDEMTHFQLSLTSAVSEEDFVLGYCLTGFLQHGRKVDDWWEMTHYAMVRRKGY